MRIFLGILSSSCICIIATISLLIIGHPFESYSSTTDSVSGNVSSPLQNDSVTNPDNLSLLLDNDSSTINLELSPSTRALLNSTSLDQEMTDMNLTSDNSTQDIVVNNTQLSGAEKIRLLANFSAKPEGLETDYSITDKPLVWVNNIPLTYEFVNDTSDEITVSDILISMRASVKLDNTTSSSTPVYIKVFSSPVNSTKNPDGSETLINSPNRIENIEIGGVIFSDVSTSVRLNPNGTGTLNATN